MSMFAPMLLAAVMATDPAPEVNEARKLDLSFSTELAGRDGEPAADVKLEGGAVELGVDVEGRHQGKARVELALSTRVAAFSVRF